MSSSSASKAARDSGVFEAPQEGPIAEMHARMLDYKQHLLGESAKLEDEDLETGREIVELTTLKEQLDAYNNWACRLAKTANAVLVRKLIQAEMDATIDHLTGALNRRGGEDFLQDQMSQIRRERFNKEEGRKHRDLKISLISMDIDHFKKFNDMLGHGMGDLALKEFTDIVTGIRSGENPMIRDYDKVARWGGEEFMVIMKDAKPEDARRKAEAIRAKVEAELKKRLISHCKTEEQKTTVANQDGTVSIGVTSYGVEDSELAIDELSKQADRALYHAKNNGRNRVTVFSQDLPLVNVVKKVAS